MTPLQATLCLLLALLAVGYHTHRDVFRYSCLKASGKIIEHRKNRFCINHKYEIVGHEIYADN